jgi:hypothetical protein
MPSRRPDTATGHGVGHGGSCGPGSISATSGRLDGLKRRRRTLLRETPPAGSPFRACGSRAPLKENRPAFTRWTTGGCPAPVPRAPGVRRRRHARRCATSRAQQGTCISCLAQHEKGRIDDVGRPRGPRAAEPVISPVAIRSQACRVFFSDDWLRHAHSGELVQRRPAPSPCAQVISLPKSVRPGARLRRPWWRAMFEIVRRSRPGRGARRRRACMHPSSTVARNCGPCPQPSIGTRSSGAWLSLRLCAFALCSPVTDQTVSGNHGQRQEQRQRQRAAPGPDADTETGHGPRSRTRSIPTR